MSRTRLKPMQLVNIIADYEAGSTVEELAEEYNMTKEGLQYHLLKENCSRKLRGLDPLRPKKA